MSYNTYIMHSKERKIMSKKSDKFKELARSRVNRAINMIRLIANLGNKAHYDYTREHAR